MTTRLSRRPVVRRGGRRSRQVSFGKRGRATEVLPAGEAPARLPVVALVGRPNTGKSTLFNRLTHSRRALVASSPGVTRDRNIAPARIADRQVLLVDTGGFEADESENLARAVRGQALIAAEEADVVVVVVDGRAGLNPLDRAVVEQLRGLVRSPVLAVNKVDTPKQEALQAEFHALGIETVVPISAEHGVNVSALTDAIAAALLAAQTPEPSTGGEAAGAHGGKTEEPASAGDAHRSTGRGAAGAHGGKAEEPASAGDAHRSTGRGAAGAHGGETKTTTTVAIIGRPNVGKSSLLNCLLGFERAIVTPVAGTTRDAIDTQVTRAGRSYVLVDTAGVRRRSKVTEHLERASVVRALGALERAEVGVLVIDATEGVTDQDARIGGYAWERGRGFLLVVNKWDAVPAGSRRRTFAAAIDERFPSLAAVPKLFVSALAGEGVERIWGAVDAVAERHRAHLPTARINQVIEAAVRQQAPPAVRDKRPRLFYATQTATAPPTVTLFCGHPERITTNYERYLTNQLRAAFDLQGTPLRLRFRARERPARRSGRRGVEKRG